MHNSKFISFLKRLEKKEVRNFEKYLQAFYANQEIALALFHHINSFHPELDSPKLSKPYVAKRIFNDQGAVDKRISNELHKLLSWLEEFLAWEYIQKNDHLKYQILLPVYKEKQLDDFFYSRINKLRESISKYEISIDKFLHLSQLEHFQYYFTPTHKINKKDHSIEKAVQLLDRYHQLLQLKHQCELKSREKILHKEAPGDKKATGSASNKLLDEEFNFLHEMFSNLLELIDQPNERTFFLLKKTLSIPSDSSSKKEVKNQADIHIKNLNDEDQNSFLSYLTNYTIRLNHEGNAKGTKEAFDIFNKGIEHDLIITDGYISEPKFLNIVNTACDLGEFEWTRSFVEKFKDHLPKEWKEDIITIALARVAFGEVDFDKTMELLREARFRDHTHTIHSKMLLLRCYYELKEEIAFPDLRKSFTLFLKRNKTLNKGTISSCKNFMKILELLVSKKQEKKAILKEINEYKLLACKPWLLKKLEDYPD